MKGELTEYRVEFRPTEADEWSSFTTNFTMFEDAKVHLEVLKKEYPAFYFRITMRIVSPWCECKEST